MINLQSTSILVSGSIGLTVLQKHESFPHHIYIYYDDHDNNQYCYPKNELADTSNDTSNHMFINEIFEKAMELFKDKDCSERDFNILVEEPLVRDRNLKFMWSNSSHLNKFLKFYFKVKKDCNIFSVDIRNSLMHESLYVIIGKIVDKDTSHEYSGTFYNLIYPLLYFFNIIKKDPSEHDNSPLFCNMKIIKKLLIRSLLKTDIHIKNIMIIYKKLKSRVSNFYSKYKHHNNAQLNELIPTTDMNPNIIIKGYPFTYQKMSWIDELELIYDTTMDLYTIIMMFSNLRKHNMMYLGLAHSSNICFLLKTIFDYKEVYTHGFTESNLGLFNDTDKFPIIKSCIKNKFFP